MVAETTLRRIIEKVYAAALDEELWPGALADLADALGAVGVTLEITDKASATPLFYQSARIPDVGSRQYVEHYSKISPRVRLGMTSSPGRVHFDYQMMEESELERDRFYSEFLPPLGLKYFVSGTLLNDDKQFSVVAAQRSPKQGHVEDEEIETTSALIPHLCGALEIHKRLSAARGKQQSLEATLEFLNSGALLLDKRGRVLFANAMGREILACGDGLSLEGGEIRLTSTEADTAAGRSLSSLFRMIDEDDVAAAADVIVPRPSGRRPYLLSFRPVPHEQAIWDDMATPVVVVFVHDPEASAPLTDALLKDLFGLSPAESRLARALQRGEVLKSYAAERAISLNTARTYLSRLMRKTSTHRQAELVRLLDSLSPPIH